MTENIAGQHPSSSSSSSSGSSSESEDLFGDKEDLTVASETQKMQGTAQRAPPPSFPRPPTQTGTRKMQGATQQSSPQVTPPSRKRDLPESTGPKHDRVELERHSGLKITNRSVGAERFDEMMKGKRACPLDRLDRLGKEKAGENWVVVCLLYERSLSLLSKKGTRYVRWSFTDLAHPKSNQFILYLFEEAFTVWEEEGAENARIGSIFAVLNPLPMSDDKTKSKSEERTVLKVSYGTQLVKLGTCPSLSFCTAHKKDGGRCSMPCDVERGKICFYHAQANRAAQVKAWGAAARGKSQIRDRENFPANRDVQQSTAFDQPCGLSVLPSRASAQKAEGYPASTSSSASITGPKRRNEGTAAALRLISNATIRDSKKVQYASLKPRQPPSAPSKVVPNALSGLSRASEQEKCNNSQGTVPQSTANACSGPSSAPQEQNGKVSQGMATSLDRVRNFDPSAPSRGSDARSQAVTMPDPTRPEAERQSQRSDQPRALAGANDSLAAQLRARFPGGLRAPNPNWSSHSEKQQGSVAPSLIPVLPSGDKPRQALLVHETNERTERARSRSAPDIRTKSTTSKKQLSAEKRGMVQGGLDLSLHGIHAREERIEKAKEAQATKSKLTAMYGQRVAEQLLGGDPTKDIVRWKKAQASEVVEQERIAKRDRELSELQFKDEMSAKMEALMSLEVPAWRCQDCSLLSESASLRQDCLKKGHNVSSCTAKKTKWECTGCKRESVILDRDLPELCGACGREANFRQVPFQRPKTAPMEKDKLLPRGEEIQFLNTLGPPPKGAQKNQTKECGYEKAFGTAMDNRSDA